MEGFKIICNDCGREVTVRDDTTNRDYKDSGFTFSHVQSDGITIGCSCNNDVYIYEQ